jgi:hypothetical protein
MVRGLAKFREQFRSHAGQYVIIGGTACDLLMGEAGLDEAYYSFLQTGKRIVEDIPVVGPEYLIPLKARAWIDLKKRKEAGTAIDAKSIAKHKNDVFRLYRLVDPAFKTDIPKNIRDDMGAFLEAMGSESVDLKNLGIKDRSLNSILDELRRIYVPI